MPNIYKPRTEDALMHKALQAETGRALRKRLT